MYLTKNKKCLLAVVSILFFIYIIFFIRIVYAESEAVYPVRSTFEGLRYEVKWLNDSKEILIQKNNEVKAIFSPKSHENNNYFIRENKAYIFQSELKEIILNLDEKYENEVLLALANPQEVNGKQAPIFSYVRGDEFITCDYLDESTYYVMFWATWCPHCKNSIEYLKSLSLTSNDLKIIPVSIDEDRPSMLNQTTIYDSRKELFKAFGGEYIPTIFKIEKGNIVKKYMGGNHVLEVLRDIKGIQLKGEEIEKN